MHRAGFWVGQTVMSALALGAGMLAAQQAQPDNANTTIHSTSKLVLVDVVVDEKNKPAHGVARDRFKVTEDGKERPIVSFEEHRIDDPNALKQQVVLPPHVYSNGVMAATNVVNVLLLDGLNTAQIDQMRSRKQMLEYAAKIQSTAPVAVFTLNTGLQLVTGFTSEPGVLQAALKSDTASIRPSVLLDDSNSHVPIANQMVNKLSGDSVGSAVSQFEADRAAYQMDARVAMTLSAMQQLARYLSLMPGRKNVLWLSGSFPIALDADNSLDQAFNTSRSYADDIRRTDALLSEARVAVYPVDLRGLMTLPAFDPAYHTASQATTPLSGPGSAVEMANKAFLNSEKNERYTMDSVASDTGGRSFVNTNDLTGAMRQAVDDGSSYYTISFVPASSKPDGQYHKIRVQVAGGDYQLAYRRGYFADLEGKMKPSKPSKGEPDLAVIAMQGTLMPGAPPATQIIFQARVLPSTDAEFKQDSRIETAPGGEMSYDMHVPKQRFVVDMRINVASLRYATGNDGTRQAQMEMTMAGYDDKGKRVNLVDQAFPLRFTEAEYKQLLAPGLPVRTLIDLPNGQDVLRIAVRQVGEERLGSVEVPLVVNGTCAGCVRDLPKP